ncbi:MAG: hypothetical protein WCW56_00625 [Candidatus Paceibacterota bacterium]
MKKYFFILSLFILTSFLLPVLSFATPSYFPVLPDAKNPIGLRVSAGFDLEKNQVGLKIFTKSKTKLEAISLVVDNNSPVRLTPASSTTFWLDLSSGDRALTISVADQGGYMEQATSSVFVPHLQAPYINLYPLTIYRGRTFVLGGQTVYPSKKVVIHLVSNKEDKTFFVDTDQAGQFNWSGKFLDQGEIEIWAEVFDGSLSSRPSNLIKLKTEKIFSTQWFSDLYTSAQSSFILRLTFSILLFIALISLLLHLLKRDKQNSKEVNEKKLSASANCLRQDVLCHLDTMLEAKDLPREVSLPILLDLKRTVEIVNKYLQTQIKSLPKKRSRARIAKSGPKKRAAKK